MKPLCVLMLAAAAMTLAACGGDRIVGRFNEATCAPRDPTKTVADPSGLTSKDEIKCSDDSHIGTIEARVTSIPTQPAAHVSICGGFEAEAAAECVKAVAAKTDSLESFNVGLGQPLGGDGPPGFIDRTTFKRILAITVVNKNFNPSDRLEYATIQILPKNASFVNWEAVTTEHEAINLGKLTVVQKRSFEGGINIDAPATQVIPVNLSGSAKATASDERQETLDITARVEKAFPSIGPAVEGRHPLNLDIRGAPGKPLTGTVLVQATLKMVSATTQLTPVLRVDRSTDPKTKEAVLELAEQEQIVASQPADIGADINMVYRVRHVRSGDSTYEERDDKALFLNMKAPVSSAVIVPKSDMSTGNWKLVTNPLTPGASRTTLSIAWIPNADPIVLCVGSRAAAYQMIRLLLAQKAKTDSLLGVWVGENLGAGSRRKFTEAEIQRLQPQLGC